MVLCGMDALSETSAEFYCGCHESAHQHQKLTHDSAAQNNQSNEGVAIKKVTNVFSKKILAKRALREIKLLQHFRGHRNVRDRTSSYQASTS